MEPPPLLAGQAPLVGHLEPVRFERQPGLHIVACLCRGGPGYADRGLKAEYFVFYVVNMLPLGVPRVGAAGCWRPGAV